MKGFWLLFQLSIRNLWRQRRRNSILLVAVVIAIAGVLNMNAITRGMLLEVVEASVNNLTGHIKIQHPKFQDSPNLENGFPDHYEVIKDGQAFPIEGSVYRLGVPAVIRSERETRGVQLYGVDPELEGISLYADLAVEGRTLEDSSDRGVLIGKALAEDLQTKLNRRLVVMVQDEQGLSQEMGVRIVGLYQASTQSLEKLYVFTGLKALQTRLNTERVTELSIRLGNVEDTDRATDFFRAELQDQDLAVHNWLTIDPFSSTMYQWVGVAIYVMTIVIMGSLVFGLINTFVTAVMERVREFGLLRSVGMQDWQVMVQVLIESTVLMVIGIIAGLLLGYLIYLTYEDGIDFSAFAQGMEMTGMRPVFKPSMEWQDISIIIQLSVVLGILASLYPARRAMKLTPLEAIRG